MRHDDGLTPKRFNEVESQAKAVFGLTLAVAIIILLVTLAGLGLLGWAVVELVQWVTSQ